MSSDDAEARQSFYAGQLEYLKAVAYQYGYALAVHGSMRRDFDLIAVPWVETASAPDVLAEALRAAVDGALVEGRDPRQKPHGRRAWAIHLPIGSAYLDLSITPVHSPESEATRSLVEAARAWRIAVRTPDGVAAAEQRLLAAVAALDGAP